MRTTAGPAHIDGQEIDPEFDPLHVFRIIKSPDDPLESLRSNYENGRSPRGLELSWAVLHVGVSVFLDETVARRTSERWPKLGQHIAELALRRGHGFNIARTSQPLHLTLWGDPVKLLAAIVDTRPV